MDNIKLSVVIASRNRANYLTRNIVTLFSIFERLDFLDYEIVVSNNHSKDGTESFLKAYAETSKQFIATKPDRPLKTAEEHFDYAISQCRGEYIWTLGDDDVPLYSGVEMLLKILMNKPCDILIFNSKGITNNGELYQQKKINLLSSEFTNSFVNQVCLLGLTYILAGYSCIVFKNEKYKSSVFREYFNISQIYSHVFTYIGCFSDSEAKILDIPLVLYRRNVYAEQVSTHWIDYTYDHNIFDNFPWTLGLVRMLKKLISEEKLPHQYVTSIIDFEDRGHKHLWYKNFLTRLIEQIQLDINGESRIMISLKEYVECLSFIGGIIPERWNLLFSLDEMKPFIGKRLNSNKRIEASKLIDTMNKMIDFNKPLQDEFEIVKSQELSLFSYCEKYFIAPATINPFQFTDFFTIPALHITSLEDGLVKIEESRKNGIKSYIEMQNQAFIEQNSRLRNIDDQTIGEYLESLNMGIRQIHAFLVEDSINDKKRFTLMINRIIYKVIKILVPGKVRNYYKKQ